MRYTKAYERFFYRPLRVILSAFLRLRYGYRHDKMSLPEGGVLVAANHTAGIDPLFCAVCFPQPLSFVMSEHLKRKKLLTKMMDGCFETITRVKTRTESQTAFTMIKRLKEGGRVLIFPEGNMTYSGASGKNMPGLGRLVKISGSSLVTVRLENTFAISPRWSKKSARGDCYGRIMRVYSPQELKTMSAAEIEDAMTRDLAFDFYAQPCGHYRNVHRAECLQSALFVCPRCKKMTQLHAKRSHLWCDCGFSVRLNDQMRFVGSNGETPFATIRDWYSWQQTQVPALCESVSADAPLTSNDAVRVNGYTVSPPRTIPITRGRVSLYRDRLQIDGDVGFSIALDEITDVTTVQRRLLCLCVNHEKFYELVGGDDFSPVKYAFLIAHLSTARSMI